MANTESTIRKMMDVLGGDPDEAKVALSELDKLDDLLMRYEAAIREVRTKLEILNDELSLKGYENPIINIISRRKKTVNILEKLKRQGDPISLESIQENLNDVAGIRVICSFIDDIYDVANMLVSQDDVTLIGVKDYIQNPKPNGYRSYHMIIEVPIFFSNEKRPMRVEVQIRTVAMDFWASLEHRMKYKQDIENAEEVIKELKDCADTIAATDAKMIEIRDKITKIDDQNK
ncbi:MAG: GTP pyrophosphokinase family protein [Firmicutes bacterium]|nr:GTP pyrophosphokinase family protein [Bacillota bacterium]